jgi:hypothetical protein
MKYQDAQLSANSMFLSATSCAAPDRSAISGQRKRATWRPARWGADHLVTACMHTGLTGRTVAVSIRAGHTVIAKVVLEAEAARPVPGRPAPAKERTGTVAAGCQTRTDIQLPFTFRAEARSRRGGRRCRLGRSHGGRRVRDALDHRGRPHDPPANGCLSDEFSSGLIHPPPPLRAVIILSGLRTVERNACQN